VLAALADWPAAVSLAAALDADEAAAVAEPRAATSAVTSLRRATAICVVDPAEALAEFRFTDVLRRTRVAVG